MKRILSLSVLAAGAVLLTGTGLHAQDMYDALRYTETNYYGTARSIGLGNAVTALGGDLGTIAINPAGAAVNSYSQLTLTPGVAVSTNRTSFNPAPHISGSSIMTDRNSSAGFIMPNWGAIITIPTGNRSGLKSFSWGFVGNVSNYYRESYGASAVNGATTYMGSMAAWAQEDGLNPSTLDGSWDNSPWDMAVAYRSGLISTLSDGRYIGATETVLSDGSIGLCGDINQRYARKITGSNTNMVINFSANFSDKFFIGANFGMVSIRYRTNAVINENPVDPSLFEYEVNDIMSQLRETRYRSEWYDRVSGIYAKAGFLWTPDPHIRIGAAVQTPTLMNITNTIGYAGDAIYNTTSFSSESPYDEGVVYRLTTPWRFNVGAALVYPGVGLVSADYERVDYSRAYFSATESSYSSFSSVNTDITNGLKASNMLRLGVELNALPQYSIRAGYTMATSPEILSDGSTVSPTQSASIGFGYQSNGSFFFDLALRGTFKPDQYTYPYEYPTGSFSDGTLTPEIIVGKRSVYDVVATFGWRF